MSKLIESFEVFRNVKTIFTINFFANISLTISIFSSWYFRSVNLIILQHIFTVIGILVCVLIILLLTIFRHLMKEKPKGKLIGKIDFYTDKIIVLNREIRLNEISFIDFQYIGFKGQYILSYRNLNPAISNGMKNTLKIELKNGEQINLFIKLIEDEQNFRLNELFLDYRNSGIYFYK